MRQLPAKLGLLLATLLVQTAGYAPFAAAAGIYTQLVLPFPSERAVGHSYNKDEHALVLTFAKTAPNELAALEHYDERLIKRVVVKDLGPAGTEVHLVLRDREVRAIVSQFNEPFRVSVDIYDADYAEERDPETGMPLVGAASATGSDGARQTAAASAPRSNWRFVAPDGSEAVSAAPSGRQAAGSGMHRLLEPSTELAAGSDDLSSELRAAPEGAGKAWHDYPPYLYRLQTAAFEEGLGRDRQAPGAHAAGSAEQMADYAGKLFNFGQESKALLAYQQVLHKDPTVFDRDALHLWKFSESQLGQGNLTLADGYFEALIQKHPESPLAGLAALRRADIAALHLIAAGNYGKAAQLLPALDAIKVRRSGELAALIAIRRGWWEQAEASQNPRSPELPLLSSPVHAALAAAYPATESSHTAFLAASLLLHDMLAPAEPWQRATGAFAEAYFKRFTGNGAEPYRSELKDQLYAKLNSALQQKVQAGKLLEAAADYEALPSSLRSIKKDTQTAWALAEAFRRLGQTAKAVELYATAAAGAEEGPGRFKAEFWTAVTAGELAEEQRKAGGSTAAVARLAKQSGDADKAAGKTWARLKPEEQQQLGVAYKEPFEQTINAAAKLRTGPKIVLANWTQALSTKASAQSSGSSGSAAGASTSANGAAPAGGASEWARNFSPAGSTVILLTDLAKRFAQLGMQDERKQATALLKFMQPKEFEDDKAAKAIWAAELIKLAEDYRKANQYLDAGRLFTQVGAEAENWEGRAEALYKGGLLLYRAGRRAEALDAFKQAGDDGNNLFYANLAKERLSQLQQ